MGWATSLPPLFKKQCSFSKRASPVGRKNRSPFFPLGFRVGPPPLPTLLPRAQERTPGVVPFLSRDRREMYDTRAGICCRGWPPLAWIANRFTSSFPGHCGPSRPSKLLADPLLTHIPTYKFVQPSYTPQQHGLHSEHP